MQNSTNIRILELLRFLYERTDENHPAIITELLAYLESHGIHANRKRWRQISGISKRLVGTSSATGAVRTSTSSGTEGWNWRN